MLELYYDQSIEYPDAPLKSVFQELQSLVEAKGENGTISFARFERASLTENRIRKIADDIRSIKPQSRGAVVTSGGYNLPFSGTKKLNLNNTPIILVRSESVPRYVFPCRVGEKYYNVMMGIEFLRDSLPNLIDLPAETEDSITSRIIERPELLEAGLALISPEVETSTGRVDLLFKDKNGRLLLVEVERVATDQSVGQILRLCAGYENKDGLEPGTVQAGLACMRINDNVRAAAKRAGIEVWKIPKENIET